MAAQYALSAEVAGGRMHDWRFLPNWQALDLLSGNPEGGWRRWPYDRIAHLVARDAHQQEIDRRPTQRGNRERLQRGEVGPGRRALSLLPLPGAATSAGDGDLSRHA